MAKAHLSEVPEAMRPAGYGNPVFSKNGYLKNQEFTELQGSGKDVFNKPIAKKTNKSILKAGQDEPANKGFLAQQEKDAVTYRHNFIKSMLNQPNADKDLKFLKNEEGYKPPSVLEQRMDVTSVASSNEKAQI